MNEKRQIKALYTTLDSVLDVRADMVLKFMDGKTMGEVRDMMLKYVKRKSDYFDTEAMGDVLKQRFKNRNVNHLNEAMETSIVDHIYNASAHVANYYKGLGYTYKTVLYLNTYPYDLTPEDTKRVEKAFSNSRPWDGLELKMVHQDHSSTTPMWLKKRNVMEMWDVDGLEWLNVQADNGHWTEDTFMAKVFLHVPGVLSEYTNDIQMEYSKVDKDSGLDIWDAYSLTVTVLIKLDFIPAIDFTSRELVKVFIPPSSPQAPNPDSP